MGYLPFLAAVSLSKMCGRNRPCLLRWPARRRTATGSTFKLSRLLDLSLGAGRLELLLDLVGFFLGHTFADRLRGAFDQGFGFRQTEAGDCRANFLDDADLVRADFLEDDIKLGLRFRRRT